MISFLDRRGRLWASRIDVDGAVRMRDLAGVDVMALTDDVTAERFASLTPEASEQIVNAIYCLFLPRCEAERIAPLKFGKLFKVTAEELRDLFFDGAKAFFRMPGPPKEVYGDGRKSTPAELWRDIYRLAGEASVDPGPRTYGELAVLADGKRRGEWSRFAYLRADVINSTPFRKGQAAQPADLDPTGALKEAGAAKTPQIEITGDDIGLLGRMFSRMGRG